MEMKDNNNNLLSAAWDWEYVLDYLPLSQTYQCFIYLFIFVFILFWVHLLFQ